MCLIKYPGWNKEICLIAIAWPGRVYHIPTGIKHRGGE